ncbi:MAG: hypothetical protein QNL99_15105 [SAR86 cluster bacterium]|jgi:hypothetical protein|uniref:DUF4124 domain-containing protein n=1 Tax=SAR86 cluster bacterium TaxID=2030880 RepID=A0A973A8E2_9GAMM|nr:DUF4124 domain-containing protein [SAR86 cluster bacterium]
MKNSVCFILLLLSSVNAYSEDEYYVWVDDNGVTNYAQQNPRDYPAKHVTSVNRFSDQTLPDSELSQLPSRGSRPGLPPVVISNEVDPGAVIAEDRARLAEQIAAQKRANCEIGKTNLTNLETYPKILVKGEDGEDRLLTAEEKGARTETARQTIRDNCNG